MILGLSMLFAPLNVAAFLYVPRELRGAAVGLFALLRNEGGSVGTSMAQTFQERREQFHDSAAERVAHAFPAGRECCIDQIQRYFFQRTGDANLSQRMAVQVLANIREQQASSLAYFDCFWAFGVVAVVLASWYSS